MSSWSLIKSESFTLSRAKALEAAQKHASLMRTAVEREVNPSRVKKLVAIIREGKCLPFCWATVLYDGKETVINGGHSSRAIIEVGADIPEKLTFHIDHYEAKDRPGVVELFRQFDQRWSSRSAADIAGAYQGLVPEIADCNRKLMQTAAQALSWCKRAILGEDAPTGDEVYDLLHDARFNAFFLWLNGIWNTRRELLKKEIIAVMWQTHEASESWASKFWREISFGPDFFTDDMAPGAVLIGELFKAWEDKAFRETEFPTPAMYYRKAVKAWNAHIKAERISSLKVGKSKEWPEVKRPSSEVEAA